MRLTIIPGVLELTLARPRVSIPLPRFSKDSLSSLKVAIAMLRDEENLRVRIYPNAVLNDEMLKQLPEEVV